MVEVKKRENMKLMSFVSSDREHLCKQVNEFIDRNPQYEIYVEPIVVTGGGYLAWILYKVRR